MGMNAANVPEYKHADGLVIFTGNAAGHTEAKGIVFMPERLIFAKIFAFLSNSAHSNARTLKGFERLNGQQYFCLRYRFPYFPKLFVLLHYFIENYHFVITEIRHHQYYQHKKWRYLVKRGVAGVVMGKYGGRKTNKKTDVSPLYYAGRNYWHG